MRWCYRWFVFLVLSCRVLVADEPIERPIVILIPSYNNIDWVDKNLSSVLQQKYSHYSVIYIDDCSGDGTADRAEQIAAAYSVPFTLVRNPDRRLPLANIYAGVYMCDDQAIVAIVDGDDWLYNDQVLSMVNRAYASGNVWLTHGSFIQYPRGETGWSIPIPQDIIDRNAFREYRTPTHLKTFYAWLFKKVKKEDFLFHGQFCPMAGDQALMLPMAEMAAERHAFISDWTYIYNMDTALGESKVNAELQREVERHVRALLRYERIATPEG